MVKLKKKTKNRTDSSYKNRAKVVMQESITSIRGLAKTLQTTSFVDAINALQAREGVIVTTGVGKSGFIAMKMSATLKSLGHPSWFLNPLDALHGDVGVIRDGDIIIAYSYSGESVELIKLIQHLRHDFKVVVISLTGDRGSKLAKLSDINLIYKINKEGSPHDLAPMASTTSALVLSDMLASAITNEIDFKKEHFAKFHPAGSLGLTLKKVDDIMVKGREVPCVTEEDGFFDVLEVITSGKRGVTAVVNKRKKLIGIITDGDIRRALLKNNNINSLKARHIMTENPKTIMTMMSLKDVLKEMRDSKVTSLFVVDKDENLKGLIHIRHIISDIT